MDISNEIIRVAAAAGVQAALDTIEKERKKADRERQDRRLRNTKLLLRNYRMFQKHMEQSIYAESQLDEGTANALDILYGFEHDKDSLIVESIQRSQARTKIIMRHIDHMLGLYKAYCSQSGNREEERRSRVIESMYITEPVRCAEEIADREHINIRTVYKDVEAACVTLSALIFGIDGIKSR